MRLLHHVLRLFVIPLLISVMFPASIVSGDEGMREIDKPPVPIDFTDVIAKPDSPASRATLRIAVAAMISPKYTYRYYISLLTLIGERMDRTVTFVQKKTYSQVNAMLKQKELDVAFVCSGPYVRGREDFGMQIIAVPICHGKTVYYANFIVSRKSGLASLADLRGKTFAFTDPLSNTGYLVPTYYLAVRGETPETFFGKTFFTYSHDNSIQAVADGLADGAAVDSLIYEFMQAAHPSATAETIVIEKSPPYGIPPVVVHPAMDPAIKKKLKTIFLSIHQDQAGKAILASLKIDRFTEGDPEQYTTVRKLQRFLESNRR
ncbi:phosphate/phosphite/phosphonate ABC transporter substrate-binding protein [Desulfosarcina ovata]|uniref:Phosphonate ABC transporter substrate-binding protein n=1 Tax=Desulfosarcina ovata subsp. ovata TaxID=2752305 RepID=A0A5K8ALE1_9BACT|nr:phosphate/phosphite/phosphonate ABC transporter substrate-binding protein [Desulfosarcina ovata]BBO92394.1 phosphonate ABC transporter substrate-binding protein [Desulfosarcina ovata subsp. ovata]